MKEIIDNQVKLSSNEYIDLDFNKSANRILIMGNTENMFGQYTEDKESYDINAANMANEAYKALEYFIDRIKNKTRIDIIGEEPTIQYYNLMFNYLIYSGIVKKSEVKKSIHYKTIVVNNDEKGKDKYINYLTFMDQIKQSNIKYDYIIQNPPYSGSFHLKFLEKGLDILEKQGRMTIIEPATWLINVRKNGKAKLYDNIKSKLKNHVSKVVIENYNIEFRTDQYMPFAITYIDFTKEYEDIEFYCFGEKRVVKSLYDCNLIGNYDMIWNIFNKVLSYGDMMKNHIYDGKSNNEDLWYCKYPEILSGSGSSLCAIFDPKRNSNITTKIAAEFNVDDIKNDILFENEGVHLYLQSYYACGWHRYMNNIQNMPHYSYNAGKKETDKIANCLTDTKSHLENWKHFVFNNKLPLFLNMCLTIDQNNNSKEFLPWLVDKQYTDEEINNLFHFTDEEISLMDKTIKKFEKYSPWFKRYMCGKDSVSSEEVQKFIDNL
jgi:hypothetical protein